MNVRTELRGRALLVSAAAAICLDGPCLFKVGDACFWMEGSLFVSKISLVAIWVDVVAAIICLVAVWVEVFAATLFSFPIWLEA